MTTRRRTNSPLEKLRTEIIDLYVDRGFTYVEIVAFLKKERSKDTSIGSLSRALNAWGVRTPKPRDDSPAVTSPPSPPPSLEPEVPEWKRKLNEKHQSQAPKPVDPLDELLSQPQNKLTFKKPPPE